MQKTTLYLDEEELLALKRFSTQHSPMSVAQCIRTAIRLFLKQKQQKKPFSFLKKNLHRGPRKTSFADPVKYQRSLRKEWA